MAIPPPSLYIVSRYKAAPAVADLLMPGLPSPALALELHAAHDINHFLVIFEIVECSFS